MDLVQLRREVAQALRDDGWPVQPTEDPDVVRTSYDSGFSAVDCFVQLHDDGLFTFYAYLPEVAEDRRPAMSEFVTRANYGLILACLELDLDDGELRCRASADLAAAAPAGAVVVSAARAAVQTVELFMPGLSAVMSDGASARAAIEACEAQM